MERSTDAEMESSTQPLNDQKRTIAPTEGMRTTSLEKAPAPSLQIEGWRLILLLVSVFIGLFLSFLDSTIVSVALTTIADQFGDFNRSTWVITAYLLTYMAFAIIISRFSDIFGKKTVEVASFVIFICFSLGCALSRNMTELIVFRALQGIGGSGLFSMTMIIALNAVPPQRLGLISAVIGVVMVMSGVLGPVLSGAITHDRTSSNWRWIFYLNLPLGGLALTALMITWPSDKSEKRLTAKAFKSIDFLGCVLLLAASILLIFALQEGGAFIYAWSSGVVIACLTISAVAFVGFIAWQEWLARRPDWSTQLIFPTHVARQRVLGAALIVTLLSGFNYYIVVVNLPQRFQIVDGDSPVIAGVKMLPLMVSSAVGSLTAGAINTGRNLTPYTLIASASFQLLGYGLMVTLGNSNPTPQTQFGFQVLFGFGFGLAMPTVTIIAQLHSEPKWTSVTQGALTQVRSLGGSVGLAIGVIVFNIQIRSSTRLANELGPDQMSDLFRSPLAIATFTPKQQALVATVYATAFTQEMRVAAYISATCFVVSLCAFQRHPPPAASKRGQPPMQAGGEGA